MSKLIFLISLIGFISIEAVANGPAPKKTNNSVPGYGFPTSSYGPKQAPKVTIPCQTNHPDCLAQKSPQRKISASSSGEERIKDQCYVKAGNNYGDKYQDCLANNGIFHVNRNINGDDKSQSDARLCYIGDDTCKRCLAQSAGASSLRERRNQTQACLDDAKKPKTVTKPKTTPKKEDSNNEDIIVEARIKCEVGTPFKCKTEAACKAVNGVWDGRACAIAPCGAGSTADTGKDPGNLCKCDNDDNFWIERGTPQVCPSTCSADDHKIYNLVARACICTSGFEMPQGSTTCVSTTASPMPNVAACLRELQEKATSCNSAATTATNKCDADNKSTSGDTISVMQNLLQGAGSVMQASGASDNCATIAVAGSTGYYALDALRANCDTEIGTCKSTCTDANTYITSNKQKVYEKCRKDAFDTATCTRDSGYNLDDEPRFNAAYDTANKAQFESDVQRMLTTVAEGSATCQSGTAVTKRDKMMDYLNDANNTAKSANQCQCQLSSSGGDCTAAPGPAECAANPSLSGCAQVTVNCLSATDNSPKCACFKNPNSAECLNIASNLKPTTGNASLSAFAGATPTGAQSSLSGFGGDGGTTGKTGTDVSGDLSGLNSDEVASAAASGTATPDSGSPFGSAGGGSGGGIGGGQGSGADDTSATTANGSEGSDSKGIRGLFETAKSAIGGLFKGKKDDKGTYTGADGITRDADGNPIGAASKWRPRGMVRGLAGNETEIAGKFEDIWKVMNKQYKVQDQKDSFIFGEKN